MPQANAIRFLPRRTGSYHHPNLPLTYHHLQCTTTGKIPTGINKEMPRLLSNKSPKKISEVKVEEKMMRKNDDEKMRVIKIEQSMSPMEYLESRVCGLDNYVRKDFIIHEFQLRTRAEQEASIRRFMKGRQCDYYLRLLRSTYK